MTEFLKNLWTNIFGTTEWLGLNIGFWMSMLAVVILVVVMIVVFWTMKPKANVAEEKPIENNDKGEGPGVDNRA